jgi:hypothetical protein
LTWYKPFLIEEVFLNHPDCDYVLFMDIDAIFCNNNRKIEEFITNDFSILMTEDHGPSLVNAGVMLLKNNQFSKEFIKDWWDICEEFPNYKQGLWHDQTCIGLLHQRLKSPEQFKIIKNNDFNAREYNEERFIFHAFAYGSLPNRSIDNIYKKKFNYVDTVKRENINASQKNLRWITDGIVDRRYPKNKDIPIGYINGRSFKLKKSSIEKQKQTKKLRGSNKGASNPSAKSILQYDMKGNLLKEYSTIKQAELETGISKIGCRCSGKIKQHEHFIFKYK